MAVMSVMNVMYLPCREYKEALRQQRAHDGVYRPRMSGDGAQQTMSVSSELLKQDGSSGSSYTNQPQALINHTNHVCYFINNFYFVEFYGN